MLSKFKESRSGGWQQSFILTLKNSAALAVIIGVSLFLTAGAAEKQAGIRWDPVAAKEVEGALTRLHEAWNSFDLKALQDSIIGDDVLVTFDLDPDTAKPIKLASRQELLQFTRSMLSGYDNAKTKTLAEHPAIACRAASGLGICTEECKVKLFLPNGIQEVQLLRGTAVAVKTKGGWKWIEWHMSEAAPKQYFDKDGKQVTKQP